MHPDELPIFRPKVGGGGRPAIADDTFRRAVYRSEPPWKRVRGGPGSRTQRSRIHVRAPSPLARRAFVRTYIARVTRRSAQAAARHLRYIERDGVERDGSRGVLYGREGPVAAIAYRSARPQEKHQFRLIVSPEDGYDLDLTSYVRRLMAQVEADLGQKLEWAAVNHHDTGHAHAHVVVRGVDRDGAQVRLDPQYMMHGLRWRAQEVATQELGPRLAHDNERRREVTEERYTALDRELARREKDQQVALGAAVEQPSTPGIGVGLLVARLAHLERYRLARRTSATSWTLAPDWADTLRQIERRARIVQRMHMDIGGDPARYRIVFAGQPLEPSRAGGEPVLTGRVVRTGPGDARQDHRFVVVETPNGSAYHLSLDARSVEPLQRGDLVTFTTHRERTPLPEASSKTERAVTREDALPSPPRHRIDPPSPRHRIEVRKHVLGLEQQVRTRGPVWLDTLAATPLAPYGFGVDVRNALKRRDTELRALGIDPADPARIGQLQDLERGTPGRQIAARTGQSLHPGVPVLHGGTPRRSTDRDVPALRRESGDRHADRTKAVDELTLER
jgi:type IV secretory pathway VirD2 relaxase